jgi:hypothetical protein
MDIGGFLKLKKSSADYSPGRRRGAEQTQNGFLYG